jgi:hypothetical protein
VCAARDTGVVERYVQPARLGFDAGDYGGHVLLFRHVGSCDVRGPACLCNQVLRLGQIPIMTTHAIHHRAALRECARGLTADT